MPKYVYVLLGLALIVLISGLVLLTNIEVPLLERASLPKCDNGVVIDTDLKYSLISYANQRIIQGTGESYFNNHFIYKNLDYSTVDCTFTVRYEYTYDKLHTDMSITLKAFSQNEFDILTTNTFLRPVGLLVKEGEALDIAKQQGIDYSYYNVDIDIEKQTFAYEFYKESMTEGSKIVLTIDAQSREITKSKSMSQIIPIV